jgi:hypothetical protein
VNHADIPINLPREGVAIVLRGADGSEEAGIILPLSEYQKLREANRQLTIERDDYKAVVVAREAGYAIERIDGGWWWWRRSEMGCAQYGPYPHMFAAARAAIGEVKGQAAVKAQEHLAARDAVGEAGK